MFKTFQISMGQGRLALKALIAKTEEGIHIYIGGGDKAHIGTTVISQPRLSLTRDGSISCTTSTFNLLGHKDHELALPIAEEICKHFNQTIIVTAGVHIGNASSEEISQLQRISKQLLLLIIETIQE